MSARCFHCILWAIGGVLLLLLFECFKAFHHFIDPLGLIVRIDNLIPPGFQVITSPSHYTVENRSINMKGRNLGPLKMDSIKLRLQALEAGLVQLSPTVVYVNEEGQFRTHTPEPVLMAVHPKLTVEFKTKAAQKVFDYLANSFIDDYMRRRLVMHTAGWRSFVQIIRNAKVSARSVYGNQGQHGSAVAELERRGLIEMRIFPGQRGRGGQITKTRVSYEKELVKQIVNQKIAKTE